MAGISATKNADCAAIVRNPLANALFLPCNSCRFAINAQIKMNIFVRFNT
nr:MAG TPA: hypothetical protein [Bacteriophage sp.]